MLKTIAFDFDGTMADSVDFCLHVFREIFIKYMGEKAPATEEIYQSFGMNEPGVIRLFLGHREPAAEADFFQLHRELHMEMCPEPFPGIVGLLEFLKSRGVRLGVITGRDRISCDISLDCLGLKKYFDFFRYGDFLKNDKCGQLLEIIEEYGLKAGEIAYVGDAVSDVESSHRAGVKCYAAAWAKSARIAELEKINPGLVFRSVSDMQNAIAGDL